MKKLRVTRNSRQAHFGSQQISFLHALNFNPKRLQKNIFIKVKWKIVGGAV